ncbi:MAG TPA: histone [archaeon]|nr:histone [archaeon]
MPRKKSQIAAATMVKFFKEAGAERVADAACARLAEALNSIAADLAKESWRFAQHAKRKTVKSEDVEIAVKMRK